VSRTYRSIPALCAVLFAITGLAACGGGVPGNAVVKVGDTPITTDTFKHWLAVAAVSSSPAAAGTKAVVPLPPNYTACIAQKKAIAPKPAAGQAAPTEAQLKVQCEQQYQALKQEVLSFLLSSQWVLSEAASLGVSVSDKEVKKHFEQIKSQQFPKAAEFQKFLASSGQTVSDLLLRVKLNLLSAKIQEKIVKAKSKPTQAQIEKYYKENPQRFGTPEKRILKIVLTKTEAEAVKAKQELESGKSFASVAKSRSIDPTTKANGGVLVAVKGQQEPTLDSAVFSAKKNVLVGPVKTPFGYYVFEVTSTTPGSQATLAQAKASIVQQLGATQQQTALSTFVKQFRKKWTAATECRAGYVVTDCKEFKAPKTSVTPTPVVPSTSTQAPTTTAPATTTTK
jgi:foldase protein PrsA